jgi:hypothetical protein
MPRSAASPTFKIVRDEALLITLALGLAAAMTPTSREASRLPSRNPSAEIHPPAVSSECSSSHEFAAH